MSELMDTRRRLQEIVGDLEAIRARLGGILEALPPPAGETDPQADLEELDPVTEIRLVVQCVLQDWIRPAINDLCDAADTVPGGGEG